MSFPKKWKVLIAVSIALVMGFVGFLPAANASLPPGILITSVTSTYGFGNNYSLCYDGTYDYVVYQSGGNLMYAYNFDYQTGKASSWTAKTIASSLSTPFVFAIDCGSSITVAEVYSQPPSFTGSVTEYWWTVSNGGTISAKQTGSSYGISNYGSISSIQVINAGSTPYILTSIYANAGAGANCYLYLWNTATSTNTLVDSNGGQNCGETGMGIYDGSGNIDFVFSSFSPGNYITGFKQYNTQTTVLSSSTTLSIVLFYSSISCSLSSSTMYCSMNNGDFYSFNVGTLTWSAVSNPSASTALYMNTRLAPVGYYQSGNTIYYIYPLNETTTNKHTFFSTSETIAGYTVNPDETTGIYKLAYLVSSTSPATLKWSAILSSSVAATSTSIVWTTVYLTTTKTAQYNNPTTIGNVLVNWTVFLFLNFVPLAFFTLGAYMMLRAGKVQEDRVYIFTLDLILTALYAMQLLNVVVPFFSWVISLMLLFGGGTTATDKGASEEPGGLA